MTSSAILPVVSAGADAIDALAASIDRAPASADAGDGSPFSSVLAAEAAANRRADAGLGAPEGAIDDPVEASHEPRTDPQPGHGRDDAHAPGRARARRGPDAASQAGAADAVDGAPENDGAPTPIGASGGTTSVAPDADTAAKPTAHAPADSLPTAADTADATVGPAVVAAAVAAPVVADVGEATAKDADDGAARTRSPEAATPAVPATPAARGEGASPGGAAPAVPATPAVPAHKATAAMATAPVGPKTAASPALAAEEADHGTPPALDAGLPVASAALEPARGSADALTALGGAPGESASAVAPGAAAAAGGPGAPVNADRRQPVRRTSAQAAKAAERTATGSPDADAGPAPAAVDAARARASIAGIVAASARNDAGANAAAGQPSDGSVPPASGPATAPTAAGLGVDPAIAATATPHPSTPFAGPVRAVGGAAAPAPAAAPSSAVDRLALDAIDRIRATVKGGVPGLESRIDDPELGAIRILVSARAGEPINAEILARDPAAARELASGIDRALAAGAALPGNLDLRVRAEAAAPAAHTDGHLPDHGAQPGRQGQPDADAAFAGGSAGSGGPRGEHPDRPEPRSVVAPVGRARGVEPPPITASSAAGASRARALDLRA